MKKLKSESAAPQPGIVQAGGSRYELTEQGSLGLLALGYRGLLAWREKRKAAHNKQDDGQKAGK